MSIGSFPVRLGRAYFNRNFFHVPLAYSAHFAFDKTVIDIFLGNYDTKIFGRIDRKSSKSGTPRIYGSGGSQLKDWIQKTFKEGNVMKVKILSKTSIMLLREP